MTYYFENHSLLEDNKKPSAFLLEMNAEFTSLLAETTGLVGKLDGICRFAPNLDFCIKLLTIQEACASSEIENAPARFYDFFKSDVISADSNLASNLFSAMQSIQEGTFSASLIKKTHSIIATSEARESAYRDTQVLSRDNIFARHLTHPILSSLIPAAINDMAKYIMNGNDKSGLIKAATIQYQLEVLSPFTQYSRAIARIMAMFVLKWNGLLTHPILGLSDYLSKAKVEYKDRIAAAYRHDEDMLWIMWTKFFLLAVNESAKKSICLIERLSNDWQTHIILLPQISNGNKSIYSIYEYAANAVITNVRQISDALGLSFSNVSKVVKTFEDVGILRQVEKKERYRQFGYVPVLDFVDYV